MNPPNDPPEVNVNGQTSNIERPQTSAAIAGRNLVEEIHSFLIKDIIRKKSIIHYIVLSNN